MASAIDVDFLHRVLGDNPWLVEALLEGDWWRTEAGSIRFHIQIDDGESRLPALIEFAEALGFSEEEIFGGTESLLLPEPDEPPVRFADLPPVDEEAAR